MAMDELAKLRKQSDELSIRLADSAKDWLASRVADGTISMADAFRRAKAGDRIRAEARLARMRFGKRLGLRSSA